MDYVDVDQMYEDTVCCACEQADYEMALKYGYDEDIEFDGEEEDYVD